MTDLELIEKYDELWIYWSAAEIRGDVYTANRYFSQMKPLEKRYYEITRRGK